MNKTNTSSYLLHQETQPVGELGCVLQRLFNSSSCRPPAPQGLGLTDHTLLKNTIIITITIFVNIKLEQWQ